MRTEDTIKFLIFLILLCFSTASAFAQVKPRRIHVFVALCDNKNQGIVPVSPILGNGDDPKNNLYWGALYGVKTFFRKSHDWKLISTIDKPKDAVLERCVFKHTTENVYLMADAYKGSKIKQTVIDFLQSASGNNQETLSIKTDSQNVTLNFGGSANLVVYIGHNGLMDFQLNTYPRKKNYDDRDAVILACASKAFFREPLRESGANPILWTTGLMAPEAYTLKSAIDGWILSEGGEEIRLRAAEAYHKYQKCGLKAARNLLVTGW